MHCPNCGVETLTGANFCDRCGTALQTIPPVQVASLPNPPKKKGLTRAGWVFMIIAGILGLSICGILASGPKANVSSGMAGTAARTVQSNAASTPTPTVAELRAQAEAPDPREIGYAPDSYKGQNLTFKGKANNVSYDSGSDRTWINLLADIPAEKYDTEGIVINYKGKVNGLLRDKRIAVWGISRGTEEVQIIISGAKRRVPSLEAYYIEVE